jgi:hypothetical protein
MYLIIYHEQMEFASGIHAGLIFENQRNLPS